MANIKQNTTYTETNGGALGAGFSRALKGFQNTPNVSRDFTVQNYSEKKREPEPNINQQSFTTDKTSPIPEDYSSFIGEDPSVYSEAPTDTTVMRNWPGDLGGGQYALDTANPTSLIKSGRTLLTPAIKKQLLNGLSPKLYQLDHIQPLWMGGADTPENIQILPIGDNIRKMQSDSIALTLLHNGKIDMQEAKLMAYKYRNLDKNLIDAIPMYNSGGQIDLKQAEKLRERFDKIVLDPEPVTPSSVAKNVPEEFSKLMSKEGGVSKAFQSVGIGSEYTEGLRRFGKGFVSGATLGYVSTPSEAENESSGWAGDLNNKYVLPLVELTGSVVGSITSFKPITTVFRAGLGITRSVLSKIPGLSRLAEVSSIPIKNISKWGNKVAEETINKGITSLESKTGIKLFEKTAKAMTEAAKLNAIRTGGKIPVYSRTNAAMIKGKEALKSGFEWAAFNQLNKREENDLQSRVESFFFDALSGGVMGGSAQGKTTKDIVTKSAGLFSSLVGIGLVQNTMAGDEDPWGAAVKNAAVLISLHALGNQKMAAGFKNPVTGKRVGLNEKGSLIEDFGIIDPAKRISNLLAKKTGRLPEGMRGKSEIAAFERAIDDYANATAVSFLDKVAPNAMSTYEYKVRPIETPKSNFSKIKDKFSKNKPVNEMAVLPAKLKEIYEEAVGTIMADASKGIDTPAETTQALAQAKVMVRQLYKGGLGLPVRYNENIKDTKTAVQELAASKKIPVTNGVSIDKKFDDIYIKGKDTYKQSPESQSMVSEKGYFNGTVVLTGTGSTIQNQKIADGIKIWQEHNIAGRSKNMDTIFITKLPPTEEYVANLMPDINNRETIVSGTQPKYKENEFLQAVGTITDAKTGKEIPIHLGWVATKYKIEGPKVSGRKMTKQEQEDFNFAFNNHEAVKNGFYAPYDVNFNNSTLSKAMDVLGVDTLPLKFDPVGKSETPGQAIKSGEFHLRGTLKDSNWADAINHANEYKINSERDILIEKQTQVDNVVKWNELQSKVFGKNAIQKEVPVNPVDIQKESPILPTETPDTVRYVAEVQNTPKTRETVPEAYQKGPAPISTRPNLTPDSPKMSNVSSQKNQSVLEAKTAPNIPSSAPKAVVSPLVKSINTEAARRTIKPLEKVTPKVASPKEVAKQKDRVRYSNLQKTASDIALKSANEGRNITKEEMKAIEAIDMKTAKLIKKYKLTKAGTSDDIQKVSNKITDTYSKALLEEGRAAVNDYKTSGYGLTKDVLTRVSNSKIPQKPENMTKKDYETMVKDYKLKMEDFIEQRMSGFAKEDIIDESTFGENSDTKVPVYKKDIKIQKFAKDLNKKFGVKLTSDGYIEVVNGKPIFEGKTKEAEFPQFLLDEVDSAIKIQSKYSSDFKKSLDVMSNSNNEYSKGFAETVKKGIREIFGEDYAANPILSEMLDPQNQFGFLSRLFSSVNQHGYSMSQPKKYLEARIKGTQEDVGKIGQEIKEQRDMEAITRDENAKIPRSFDRVKDLGQEEGMVQDIIGIENAMPGLIKEEVFGTKANKTDGMKDAVRILVKISKEYNHQRSDSGKPGVFFKAKDYQKAYEEASKQEIVPGSIQDRLRQFKNLKK